MSSSVFSVNDQTVMLPSSENDQHTPLVSIVAHSASSGSSTSVSKLPLLGVELNTSDRIQVDCALDGVFHILKADGGWGECTLSFMDAIKSCSGSNVNSALAQYMKMRRKDTGTVVDVTIKTKGRDVTFSGYLLSCGASIMKNQDGIATLAVQYKLLGDLND